MTFFLFWAATYHSKTGVGIVFTYDVIHNIFYFMNRFSNTDKKNFNPIVFFESYDLSKIFFYWNTNNSKINE